MFVTSMCRLFLVILLPKRVALMSPSTPATGRRNGGARARYALAIAVASLYELASSRSSQVCPASRLASFLGSVGNEIAESSSLGGVLGSSLLERVVCIWLADGVSSLALAIRQGGCALRSFEAPCCSQLRAGFVRSPSGVDHSATPASKSRTCFGPQGPKRRARPNIRSQRVGCPLAHSFFSRGQLCVVN